MSLASLLHYRKQQGGDQTFTFEHAMSHRRLTGSMSPLPRFSAIPYMISPGASSAPPGPGMWHQDHTQAHNDFVGVFPGWYGQTIINVTISLQLTNGGTGYTSAPSVTIGGGSGTGATAIATVANGQVTEVTMTSQGSGYLPTDTLTVTFTGGGGTGAAAIAVITPIFAPFTAQAMTAQLLGPGYNIQDVDLADPQELMWWTFQNHYAHLDAEFVQDPTLWIWPFW